MLHGALRERKRSRTKFGFWFIVAYVTIALNIESCVLSLEYMVLMMSLMSVVSNAPASSLRRISSSTLRHQFYCCSTSSRTGVIGNNEPSAE